MWLYRKRGEKLVEGDEEHRHVNVCMQAVFRIRGSTSGCKKIVFRSVRGESFQEIVWIKFIINMKLNPGFGECGFTVVNL